MLRLMRPGTAEDVFVPVHSLLLRGAGRSLCSSGGAVISNVTGATYHLPEHRSEDRRRTAKGGWILQRKTAYRSSEAWKRDQACSEGRSSHGDRCGAEEMTGRAACRTSNLHCYMARSQQSFNKRQKEVTRLKRREEKAQRKKERSVSGGGGELNDMLAYVDEFGRLTTVPPGERTADPGFKSEEGTTAAVVPPAVTDPTKE